jgi:hypothetical protein
MVWMFVVGGLSMWDDLDGVTERRTPLPGPVAVLEEMLGRGGGWVLRDRLQHRSSMCARVAAFPTARCG